MKIGIFGGSFNPVHKGHVKIAAEAIEVLGLDKLYFVPAYKSPFKSKEVYATAEDRVNMINLVKVEKSEVCLFEINRKGVSYTIETVKYIQSQHPNDELFLLIGTDNLYKLNKWRDISEISKLTQIVVFKREGDYSKENIKRFNCQLLNNELYNFSSTNLRKGLMDNIDEKVATYIGQNYLYVKDIMLGMLDHKRHKHSMAVATLAAEYAKKVGVSAKKAWIAGCFHDITKCWPIEKHYQYLEEVCGIDVSSIGKHELHSFSAYHWLKNEYKLNDEEILNAILKHTTLDFELSLMDKVIFAADKLCEGRAYEGIQTDRQLILQDFDKGFKRVVAKNEEIITGEKQISDKQKQIYERWK